MCIKILLSIYIIALYTIEFKCSYKANRAIHMEWLCFNQRITIFAPGSAH